MNRIKARVQNTLTKIKDFIVIRNQSELSEKDPEVLRDDLKTRAYAIQRRIV